MRFAAGFGSQIGLSLVRKYEYSGDRIDKVKLLAWNQSQAGTPNLELRVLKNKLVAYVDGENNLHGGIQGDEYATPSAESVSAAPVVAAPTIAKQEPASVVEKPSPTPPVASSPTPVSLPEETPLKLWLKWW